MTQSIEEIAQLMTGGAPDWESAKQIIGDRRVTLGPQASQQWLDAPEHLAMVLARYRAAAALIGNAQTVLEVGCGEGIGAGILARGRSRYNGLDTDRAALRVAEQLAGCRFAYGNALWLDQDSSHPLGYHEDAVVLLDVIEHLPADQEDRLFTALNRVTAPDGVCVIGTPNAAFDHLASPQSKAGHINTYTHDRLYALMARHFKLVQSFGMQDVSIHLGHPEARHYLLMAGIGPR